MGQDDSRPSEQAVKSADRLSTRRAASNFMEKIEDLKRVATGLIIA